MPGLVVTYSVDIVSLTDNADKTRPSFLPPILYPSFLPYPCPPSYSRRWQDLLQLPPPPFVSDGRVDLLRTVHRWILQAGVVVAGRLHRVAGTKRWQHCVGVNMSLLLPLLPALVVFHGFVRVGIGIVHRVVECAAWSAAPAPANTRWSQRIYRSVFDGPPQRPTKGKQQRPRAQSSAAENYRSANVQYPCAGACAEGLVPGHSRLLVGEQRDLRHPRLYDCCQRGGVRQEAGHHSC